MSDTQEKNWLEQNKASQAETDSSSRSEEKAKSHPESQEKIYTSSGEPIMSAEEFSQFEQITKGWSWAGSCLPWVTLMVGHRWGMLVFCVVTCCIPYINIIACIAWFVYGWLKGKKILYQSPRLESIAEKQGAIKALELGGLGTFIIYIIGIALFIIVIVIFTILLIIYRPF